MKTFIIRSGAQWLKSTVPIHETRPVSLAAVLSMIDDAAPRPDSMPADSGGSAPLQLDLDPSNLVEPPWLLIGEVTPRGLLIEDAHGAYQTLDRDDLALVDAIGGVSTVSDLSTELSVTGTCDRLGRLAAHGAVRVRQVSPGPPELHHPARAGGPEADGGTRLKRPTGGLAQRAGTAWRLSRRLRPVREQVERLTARWSGRGTPPPACPQPSAPSNAPVEEAEPAPPLSPIAALPAVAEAPVGVDNWQPDDGPAGRIPVYAIWHRHCGPLLALGMLTASARHWNEGALLDRYEIRRPETAEEFLADLAQRPPGPAVLLCSNYVWSLDENLSAAREGLRINSELFVVHGGPSCPKYEADAKAFLDTNGDVAHVLTRGEGEYVVCEVLDATTPTATSGMLDPEQPAPLTDSFDSIGGITFRGPGGEVIRNPDRERLSNLDDLPSPYLTGEFDHIPASAWVYCMSVETNRGCPYGCTFCDWGSSTLSRIRKFDLDRVTAEINWAAQRQVSSLNLTDANFGIMKRDIETARRIASIRREFGFPKAISYYPAKNTTKHLTTIMEVLLDAGISPAATLSLQTSDPATLEAVGRQNISNDHYVALAADYRRHGYPLTGDLLLGLPGQTYDSYRADLQFNLDHEIAPRTWQVRILPNSPMNDPEYRDRYQIESDEWHRIMSTSTFTRQDRARMLQVRNIEITTERLGVLRHVMRWLQWDHSIAATDLMDHLLEVTSTTPERFPHLTWLLGNFDLYPTAPVGWSTVYNEVRHLLIEDYAIGEDSTLDTVLALQQFLMPHPGRTFPAAITLDHDYLAYYREATRTLYTTGHAGTPEQPLSSHPPATFDITGDPLNLCENGVEFSGNSRDELMESDFLIGASSSYELLSDLTRMSSFLAGMGIKPQHKTSDLTTEPSPVENPADSAVRVTLARRT